uniref:Centromere/kinetochore protein zw10 homolog n=1 Tax=Heterorhabditis bacteriophora TaxID=37862 RepID=A0A1I7WVT5_HETBA
MYIIMLQVMDLKTHAELSSLKKSFSDLKSAVNLKLAQRQIVGQTEGYIDNLEEQILLSTVAQNEKSKEFEAKVKELQVFMKSFPSLRKKKMRLVKNMLNFQLNSTSSKWIKDLQSETLFTILVVLELAKKTEANGTLSETLQEGLIQLKEYNDHLERQFQAQTDLIEALKNKVVQQKSFADFIYKLSDMDDVSVIQEELGRYAKSDDRTTTKLVDGIGYIIKLLALSMDNYVKKFKIAKKDSLRSATIPLEISTAHHKVCLNNNCFIFSIIRPYNSVDSSGEWLSNSSEGIISPDDGESLDWNDKRKSLKAVQCDSGFSQRSPSAQSS